MIDFTRMLSSMDEKTVKKLSNRLTNISILTNISRNVHEI